MKKDYKKLMRTALALCMAVVMFCGVVVEAQAAGFAKSFTKTVTMKGGQCVMTMKVSKETKVTVTVSTTSKNKNLNIQATIAGSTIRDGDPYFVNLDSKKKKQSFTVNVTKGTHQLYITNYSMDKVKVKAKVSAKAKALKFTKKEMRDDIA